MRNIRYIRFGNSTYFFFSYNLNVRIVSILREIYLPQLRVGCVPSNNIRRQAEGLHLPRDLT